MHGMRAKWHRRRLLGTATAGMLSALAAPARTPQARAQSDGSVPGLIVRRNIYMLDPNGPEMASLRRGIAVMQQVSLENPYDPRGWQFQANIHGAPADVPDTWFWRQCEHGTFFFLPWHRMYLFWFQRILQWASGDPTLALPYWDYSVPAWRILPEAFRVPADASNPLYLAERDPSVNAGFPPWATSEPYFDHSSAFDQKDFFPPSRDARDSSFGGAWAPAPMRTNPMPKGPGLLELTPHSFPHVWIGGRFMAPDGSVVSAPMGDTRRAARDPIFWLHHANIDRLWQRWLDLGDGRANPTSDPVWMNTVFTFFDENGRTVQMTPGDVLSTFPLGYIYDDDPLVLPAASGERGGSPPVASGGGPGAPAEPRRRPRRSPLGASRAGRLIELGADVVTVPIRRDDPQGADELDIPSGGTGVRIVLSVEALRGTGVPGVSFEVYLHRALERGSTPSADAFVGILSLFGLQPHDAMGSGHAAPASTQSFDVTNLVATVVNNPDWHGRLAATFVPQAVAGTPPPPGVWAIADRVVLTIG